jgi:hypothetical protein
MLPRRHRHSLLALAFLAASCSRFVVRSHYDPQTDFASLRTFAWLPRDQAAPGDQQTPDENLDRRIVADVERDLVAKGFRPAGDGAPDFLLNYRYTTTPVLAVQGDPSYGGWGEWWLMTPGWEAEYSDDFDEGALHLAVLDPERRRVFWIGSAEARIIPSMSYDRTIARIDDAVAAMLKRFPPR